jgi:hypothetical protein
MALYTTYALSWIALQLVLGVYTKLVIAPALEKWA